MPFAMLFAILLNTLTATESAQVQRIDQLMKAYHQYDQFNGTVLVAKGDEIIYQKGFGLADVDLQIANTAQTRFPLASLSKQFTAALVLKLVAEGKLQLSDTIAQHLPYYSGEGGAKVTIRQLLNHTSGISSYGRDKAFMRTGASQQVNTKDFIMARCSGALEFEPGAQFRYSNSGYYILGAIVEAATQMDFAQALDTHLFDPLGLEGIGFRTDPIHDAGLAKGFNQYGATFKQANLVHPSVSFAAGGLSANASALFDWQRALFVGRVLPDKLLQQMITPQLGQYGFGLRCGSLQLGQQTEPEKFVAHGGSLFGFNHYQIHLLTSGIQIIILSNAGQRPEQAEQNILKILHDLAYALPQPKLVDALLPLLLEGDQPAAMSLAKRLLEQQRHNSDVATFLDTGYRLFENGEILTAKRVFEVAIELYPEHGLLFEGLGKTLLANQQIALATTTFQTAYRLDPNRCDDAMRFLKHVGADLPQAVSGATPSNEAAFERHLGVYRMSPRRTLKVYMHKGKLMAQPSGQGAVSLIAESTNQFKVAGHKGHITFQSDGDGPSTSLVLALNGRKQRGVRIP